MAAVVVVVGVGVCTVTDVKVNAKGFLCACVAIFSTSLQQIVSKYPLNFILLIANINMYMSINKNSIFSIFYFLFICCCL